MVKTDSSQGFILWMSQAYEQLLWEVYGIVGKNEAFVDQVPKHALIPVTAYKYSMQVQAISTADCSFVRQNVTILMSISSYSARKTGAKASKQNKTMNRDETCMHHMLGTKPDYTQPKNDASINPSNKC